MTTLLPGFLAIVLYLLASALLTVILMRGTDTACQRNQVLMIGLAAVVKHGGLL